VTRITNTGRNEYDAQARLLSSIRMRGLKAGLTLEPRRIDKKKCRFVVTDSPAGSFLYMKAPKKDSDNDEIAL
jgi:hypothetical protein